MLWQSIQNTIEKHTETNMQTLDYSNKVVMITGAGAGMGKLAAENFAQAGARLAICDINKENIANVAEDLRAQGCDVLARAFDVSDETQVQSFIEECVKYFDKIDVGINNAGILQPVSHVHTMDLTALDKQYQVNIKGAFACMKHQLASMMAEGGVILNLSSLAGINGAPNLSAYSSAKHAVVGMTRTAAVEYGRFNIRVNALCPSFVDSPMLNDVVEQGPISKERMSDFNPMKRLATMQEIVNAMLWMCSDYNSYMNGQAIAIDGGLTAF